MRRFIVGALAAVVVTGGAYRLGSDSGWARRDAAALSADLAREKGAHLADLRALEASQKVGGEHELAAERLRTVYRTIEREAPTHVTAAIDARFPVPVGFVRVHDAAAQGLPVADVHDPAGRPDDAAADVAASEAAAVIAGNYATCGDTAERLRSLQAWWRGQLVAAGASRP